MPYTPAQRMDILTRFLGYGNPVNVKYLFVSLEPNNDWSAIGPNEVDNKLNIRTINQWNGCYYLPKRDWALEDTAWGTEDRDLNITDRVLVKLALALRAKANDQDYPAFNDAALIKYWKDDYCMINEFMADIYPLPLPSHARKWPSNYV